LDTRTATFVYRHTRLGILTEHPADLVDLTDGLDALVAEAAVNTGIVSVHSCLPGAAIVVTAQPSPSPPHHAAENATWLPIADGRLRLDEAARVFLVELAGPAAREIAVVMVGEGRR
jgi:thiamine phosphate synthase YjbQ (UPF0047 family)